jgi:DNA-binding transcriptional regulator GbsR (MarR family)
VVSKDMLVEKYYCKGCKRKTHHLEIKKDFFECERCHFKEIRTTTINEHDINPNEIAHYLYKTKNFIYYTDSLSSVIVREKDMRDLLDGKKIRILAYRNRKFGKNHF